MPAHRRAVLPEPRKESATIVIGSRRARRPNAVRPHGAPLGRALVAVFALVWPWWQVACRPSSPTGNQRLAPAAGSVQVVLDQRTPLLPTFPCKQCHADLATNAQERRLSQFHGHVVLAHGSGAGWCFRCHDRDDRDLLRAPWGVPVAFDASHELCGSCHADQLRDWQDDLHGLTTGAWNGLQHRAPCTSCHDPHKPAFLHSKPFALPGPARAEPRAALPNSLSEGASR